MLKRLWEGWKKLAHKIGNFQARVLLTILYAILVLPFGLAVRLFADPLRIRKHAKEWLDYAQNTSEVEWARRQW